MSWLARLSVLPEERRRGYGKALVLRVIEEARRQSLPGITICVIAAHHELIRWYERLGFEGRDLQTHAHLPFEVLLMEHPLE